MHLTWLTCTPPVADVAPEPRLVAKLARQVAAGLAHLHGNGIVHRDVACRNVLVDRHMDAMLGDFGFARVLSDASDVGVTQAKVGPVRWMAPECFKAASEYSTASDVFAFGVVRGAGGGGACVCYCSYVILSTHLAASMVAVIGHQLLFEMVRRTLSRYTCCVGRLTDCRVACAQPGVRGTHTVGRPGSGHGGHARCERRDVDAVRVA